MPYTRNAAIANVSARDAVGAILVGADAYEIERRLGHCLQRHIQHYTNPPEGVTARYVEEFRLSRQEYSA